MWIHRWHGAGRRCVTLLCNKCSPPFTSKERKRKMHKVLNSCEIRLSLCVVCLCLCLKERRNHHPHRRHQDAANEAYPQQQPRLVTSEVQITCRSRCRSRCCSICPRYSVAQEVRIPRTPGPYTACSPGTVSKRPRIGEQKEGRCSCLR
jgi:hypothetical protein